MKEMTDYNAGLLSAEKKGRVEGRVEERTEGVQKAFAQFKGPMGVRGAYDSIVQMYGLVFVESVLGPFDTLKD
jgi:hypothetical protein